MTLPRARFNLPNGDSLSVTASRQYVQFELTQPGRYPYQYSIYVPWDKMIKLLPWLVKAARRREGSSYPPLLMSLYLEKEALYAEDQRRQKRTRGKRRRRARH